MIKKITMLSVVLTSLILLTALGVAQDARSPQAPTAAVEPASCVTSECHANVKDYNSLHGPVSVNACMACHTVVDEAQHTFTPAREGAELCTFCHTMNLEEAAVVHEPMNEGQCTMCHSPHGGADHKFLKAATSDELCGQCHEDVIGDKPVVHGPVAAGACAACHAPHASEHPFLLADDGPDMCMSCHVTMRDRLGTLRSVHEPVQQDCRSCHYSHSSDHKMMLKDEPQSLCEGCHESIKHTIETAKTQHAAVTGERGCMNCHDAHASDFASILHTNSMSLCFECHDQTIDMPDGTKLGNIKSVIETGTSLHGPISQDNCAACHQIHGGDNFRLLVKEYPAAFYAPFKEESYALCFSCHEPDLLRDEQTTALTNFRNGDQNLHFLHVNRDKKGRTCRACHETHASNKERQIRDKVPFGTGGWELPINFDKTDSGGSCAPGCHVPYAYDRDAPIPNLPPTANDAGSDQ